MFSPEKKEIRALFALLDNSAEPSNYMYWENAMLLLSNGLTD